MKGKTLIILLLLVVFIIPSVPLAAKAARNTPKIVDIQMDTILMDDGTIWLKQSSGYEKVNVDASFIHINEDFDSDYYALTSNGELIKWDDKSLPAVDKSHSGIKSLTDHYFLKNDGTVWFINDMRQPDLVDVSMLTSYGGTVAYLTNGGEILNSFMKVVVDRVEDVSSIVSLLLIDSYSLVYMDKTGKVVAVYLSEVDPINGVMSYHPKIVTTDAASISLGEIRDTVLVTKKDGTVWQSDNHYNDYKLEWKIEGIENAVKANSYMGTLNRPDMEKYEMFSGLYKGRKWLVQQKDGSWTIYEQLQKGQKLNRFPIQPPMVSGLTLTPSNAKPVVGNKIQFKIIQSYTNGYKEILSGKEAALQVDKPHLLKAQSDGSFTVLGVGEVKITSTVGENSKTVTVATNLGRTLTGAVYLEGMAMLPVQSTFKSLGGTVAYASADKSFDITVGSKSIQLAVGQNSAIVDGQKIALKGVVREDKGVMLFPASFLSQTLGAAVKWDSKLKQAKVSFGTATMTIETADTPKIKKKQAQGSLAGLIGKSYWVNRYNDWDRFMKLTITDIVPVGGNNFEIIFSASNGKKIKSDVTSKESVTQILSDDYSFFPFDPYKKYKWSSSTWNSIKASKISIGMNKTQVELSWGESSDTSKLASKGLNVEVWRYGYDYVIFTNGVVSQIYTN